MEVASRWILCRPLQGAFNVLVWLLVILPAILFFTAHWLVFRSLVWMRFGNQRRQMKGLELFYTCDEETCRNTVASFYVVAGPHSGDPKEYQKKFDQIMANHPDFHNVISIPEIILGYYFWRKVDKCRVEDHCSLLDGVDPEKTYLHSDVMRLYAKVHNTSFPKDKPMWMVYYVPKVAFDEEVGQGKVERKSLYIVKAHHNLGGGIPIFRGLLRYLTDQKYDYNPVPPRQNTSPIKTFIMQALTIMDMPYTLISKQLDDIWNNTHFPRLNGKKFLCSATIGVDLVRFIRRKAGCHFSDVIMSSVSASLGVVFKRVKVIRTYIVVANASEPDDYTSCDYSLAGAPFPGETMGHLERLRHTQRILKEASTSLEGHSLMLLINVFGIILPKSIFHRLFRHLGVLALVTYVPGMDKEITHNRRKVLDFHVTSIHREGTGILVGISTHLSKMRINYLVDGAVVDGREGVVQDLADAFKNHMIELGNMLGYDGE